MKDCRRRHAEGGHAEDADQEADIHRDRAGHLAGGDPCRGLDRRHALGRRFRHCFGDRHDGGAFFADGRLGDRIRFRDGLYRIGGGDDVEEFGAQAGVVAIVTVPCCDINKADMDGNGAIDMVDVPLFTAALLQP